MYERALIEELLGEALQQKVQRQKNQADNAGGGVRARQVMLRQCSRRLVGE